jgi:hypothetical protein
MPWRPDMDRLYIRHESALDDSSDAKRSLYWRICRHLIETQENVLQEFVGALAKLRASSCLFRVPNPRMGANSKSIRFDLARVSCQAQRRRPLIYRRASTTALERWVFKTYICRLLLAHRPEGVTANILMHTATTDLTNRRY